MLLDDAILGSWPTWPSYGSREVDAVRRVVKSNQLFAAGEVRSFEKDFSEYLNVDFSVGVGNATQGLHLALASLGVGEGDEVAVSNCSWISSASCILMQNAVPVFVDIDARNFGLDPIALIEAITPKTKAIIDVNILGYPSNIVEIKKIAAKYQIPLIEDASHGPGSRVGQEMIGTFGDVSVFSLQQRKAISTGDGGVVSTNRQDIADKINQLRSFGNDELSYNYRMSEFSAVLARIGLEKLDSENELRRKSALILSQILSSEDWVHVRLVQKDEIGVYYAIAVEINLPDNLSESLLKEFISRGVPMRKLFSALNKHPHFNPKFDPARGTPWTHPNYDGQMKNVTYQNLFFPQCEEFCNGRVLELYAHPGTTELHLEAFARTLKELYSSISFGSDSKRLNWDKDNGW